MQQRREEILAKKAKLAELKRQRELRASQASTSRQSVGTTPDVRFAPFLPVHGKLETELTSQSS